MLCSLVVGLLGTVVISYWRCFFQKYSPGGDTATPSGLYARFCHAFLVVWNSALDALLTDYDNGICTDGDVVLFNKFIISCLPSDPNSYYGKRKQCVVANARWKATYCYQINHVVCQTGCRVYIIRSNISSNHLLVYLTISVSVRCIVAKRLIGYGMDAVWDGRSYGSREQVVGFGDRSTRRGNFVGNVGRFCLR